MPVMMHASAQPEHPNTPAADLTVAVEQLSARVDALDQAISREEQGLRDNDTDGLVAAAEEKRTLLADLDGAWRTLHNALGRPPGTPPGVLVATLSARTPELAPTLEATLDTLRNCRLRNGALGTILAEKRRLTEDTLYWLTGGALSAPAYGPRAQSSPRIDPRSLGQA